MRLSDNQDNHLVAALPIHRIIDSTPHHANSGALIGQRTVLVLNIRMHSGALHLLAELPRHRSLISITPLLFSPSREMKKLVNFVGRIIDCVLSEGGVSEFAELAASLLPGFFQIHGGRG